jgi:hypothetical protein
MALFMKYRSLSVGPWTCMKATHIPFIFVLLESVTVVQIVWEVDVTGLFRFQVCAAGGSEWLARALVSFWLIIRALCYWHREYQIIQSMHQYQNIDTHTSLCRYILPVPTSKCQNETENLTCWCEPLLRNWQHTSGCFRNYISVHVVVLKY